MIRLPVAAGLVALFALGYAGLEKIALSEPRRQIGALASTGARYGAAQSELVWNQLLERMRGLARSTADDLGNREDAPREVLEPVLLSLLDRAGGRGMAAMIASDGRKLLSVGNGLDIDPAARAVKDARAGAVTVHLERVAGKPVLIAAAPTGDEGSSSVLALSLPLDRRALRTWLIDPTVNASVVLVGKNGEVLASTLDSGLPDVVPPSTDELEIREELYTVYSRPLLDDGGSIGSILGFAPLGAAAVSELAGRLRLAYGVLASLAVLLVISVLSVAPKRGAERREETVEAEDVELGSVGVPQRSVAEDLLAAARVLDYDGERTPLPGRPSLDPPPSFPGHMGGEPSFPPMDNRPPPPRPNRPEPVMQSHEAMPAFAADLEAPPSRPGWRPQDARPSNSPHSQPAHFPPRSDPGTPGRQESAPVPRELTSRVSGDLSRFLVQTTPPQDGPNIPVTVGRGMSPAPPNVSPTIASPATISARSAMGPGGGHRPPAEGGTPLPQLEAVPADLPLASYGGPRQSASVASERDPFRAFDEEHYRVVFDEFVGSKQRLGELVDNISFEGFSAKLRRSEQQLIDKHGCRSVRFQVVVRDRQVSLRPQLVR